MRESVVASQFFPSATRRRGDPTPNRPTARNGIRHLRTARGAGEAGVSIRRDRSSAPDDDQARRARPGSRSLAPADAEALASSSVLAVIVRSERLAPDPAGAHNLRAMQPSWRRYAAV